MLPIRITSYNVCYTKLLRTANSFSNNVELFRSGALLAFVYLLSFFGLKQQQLISAEESTVSLSYNFV